MFFLVHSHMSVKLIKVILYCDWLCWSLLTFYQFSAGIDWTQKLLIFEFAETNFTYDKHAKRNLSNVNANKLKHSSNSI